jgi:hypothetical protein
MKRAKEPKASSWNTCDSELLQNTKVKVKASVPHFKV